MFRDLLDGIAILAAAIGGVIVFLGTVYASTDINIAAAAALGLAVAGIPHFFASAFHRTEMRRLPRGSGLD